MLSFDFAGGIYSIPLTYSVKETDILGRKMCYIFLTCIIGSISKLEENFHHTKDTDVKPCGIARFRKTKKNQEQDLIYNSSFIK